TRVLDALSAFLRLRHGSADVRDVRRPARTGDCGECGGPGAGRGGEQSAARAGLRNLQCGGRPRKLPRPDDPRSHRPGHQHRQRFYYRTARNNGAVSDWDLGGAAAAQPCNRSSKSVLIEKLLSTISASLTRLALNTPG